MNKYSEWSDVEINKKVIELMGAKFIESRNLITREYNLYEFENGETVIVGFGYADLWSACDDYAVAMGLMVSNKINLRAHTYRRALSWRADGAVRYFSQGKPVIKFPKSESENPCRAIAECYLMMKEAENA